MPRGRRERVQLIKLQEAEQDSSVQDVRLLADSDLASCPQPGEHAESSSVEICQQGAFRNCEKFAF